MTTHLQQTKTMTIAHRGASSLAPENTLAAARKALELGADMYELDVCLTADGVLILGHDETLERTSNAANLFPERQPWLVHEFTLAEIRQLDRGSWFIDRDPFGQITAGKVSPTDFASYIGEPTPTLREALSFAQDHHWRVNVELKNLSGRPGNPNIVEDVVCLVESLNMAERVLISSFNHGYLKRVKVANPTIAIGALVSKPGGDPISLLRQLDAQAYHPRATIIQPDRISQLRKQGFEVNIWTVNDETLMRSFIRAGASGLFTDFPQHLKAILAEI